MDETKEYVVDTNVLLEDPLCLLKLRNGNQNRIFIPRHVLLELNHLRKHPKHRHVVGRVVEQLMADPEAFQVLEAGGIAARFADRVDRYILEEIRGSRLEHPILVTNDRMLQLEARLSGIPSEIYRESVPFRSEAEHFTGFVTDRERAPVNSFCWNEQGKPVFVGAEGEKTIDYSHRVWKVPPRNVYQNLAIELMMNPDILVVSIQSEAGYGKSFLSLACALALVLERKSHEKIYVIKPTVEIGQKLGYLPGRLDEKMEPYTRSICDLVLKLHRLRPANKIFLEAEQSPPVFNPRFFEILPLNYIRGMNIEQAVVIIDEMQNLSRPECRTLLSRMGEGVKCFCLGDTRQVDPPYLSPENNGLNWLVKKFKGSRIYAHLVLKGEKSRGPITDLVIATGL